MEGFAAVSEHSPQWRIFSWPWQVWSFQISGKNCKCLNLTSCLIGENFSSCWLVPLCFLQVAPKPNTFLPYGSGSHSCPGNELARLEVLVLLHHLTTKYRYKQPTVASSSPSFSYLLSIFTTITWELSTCCSKLIWHQTAHKAYTNKDICTCPEI